MINPRVGRPSANLFPGTKPQADTSDAAENPFEVTASVIYDEIFDGALKVLPDNILSCLRNAQHVQKILYEKHVEKMLSAQLEHT
jgi:hypothetical protein